MNIRRNEKYSIITHPLDSQGWYNYDPKVGKGRKPLPSSEMQILIDKYSMSSPQRGMKLNEDDIVSRVLFPLVNEGFKVLEEGIASDPSDIDVIYLYGYGWPAWRGESKRFTAMVSYVLDVTYNETGLFSR